MNTVNEFQILFGAMEIFNKWKILAAVSCIGIILVITTNRYWTNSWTEVGIPIKHHNGYFVTYQCSELQFNIHRWMDELQYERTQRRKQEKMK